MEKDIQIDGQNMHFDETGPDGAPAVVLMHGWGCSHTTVASIAAILSPFMKVYNLDLPGFGKSDEPSEVWGIEDYTLFVMKFINMLGLDSPVLIGHSFGGRIAILLSSRYPIKKMVLVDAAGIKPKRTLKYYSKVYSYKMAKRLLPLLFGKERGQMLIEKWRGKAGSSDYNNASPRMKAIMSRCVNEDLKSVMPFIKASTLLVWGEEDTATPISDAHIMEKLIPDAGLVAYPGCGHYSFLENPGGFRSVMNEFFKKERAGKA